MSFTGDSHFKIDRVGLGVNPSNSYRLNIEGGVNDFTLGDIRTSASYRKTVSNSSVDVATTAFHYFFNDGSGTNINDGSVNNRDATIQGSGYSWSGSGFYSNTSNFLNLTESPTGHATIASTNFTTTLTVRIIFKYNGADPVPVLELFNKRDSSGSPYTNDSFRILYDNDTIFSGLGNSIGIVLYGSSSYKYFYANTTLKAGNWYMLNVSVSLTSGEVVNLILNGVNLPVTNTNPNNALAYTTIQSTTSLFRLNGISTDSGSTTTGQKDISYAFLYTKAVFNALETEILEPLNSGFDPYPTIKYSNYNTLTGTNFDITHSSGAVVGLRHNGSNSPTGSKALIGSFPAIGSTGADVGLIAGGREIVTLGKSGSVTFRDPFVFNRVHTAPTPSGSGAYTGSNANITFQNPTVYANYVSQDFKLRASSQPVASWIFSYTGAYTGDMLLRVNTGVSTSKVPVLISTNSIAFQSSWVLNSSGHLVPTTNNTYDVGTSIAGVRDIYTDQFFVAGETTIRYPNTENTFVGKGAGSTNAHQYNTGFGHWALYELPASSNNNTCVGRYAGYSMNGSDNTIVGAHGNSPALSGATRMTTIGVNSGLTAKTENVSVGYNTGAGNYSVSVGALADTTTLEYITHVGYGAGSQFSNNSTLLGYGASSGSFSSTIVIGNKSATTSNQVAIGANNMSFLFSNRWGIDSSGHLYPQTTATYNIGSTSFRASNFYGVNADLSGNLTISGTLTSNGVWDINNGVRGERTGVGSSPFTVTSSHYYLAVDTSSIAITLDLPQASTVTDQIYIIKDRNGNANTNNITIDPNGSETIDGASTYVININYGRVTIYSNGSNWEII